jgi:hypothetical protein
LWGLFTLTVQAQCPDFLDLTSNQVVGTYGHIIDSLMSIGIMPGHHTLITQQGTDPRTGGQLPLLPDGENAVIRLGCEQAGGEMESLIYTFTVDSDQPVLLLKYAVVLEDPGHEALFQPHFLIQMLDANDELISGCMEYNVVSSPEIPGFQAYDPGNGVFVMWRPWTTNGFDLSAFAGQTVKLRLSTFDCAYQAHFGYAYFTARCISNKLSFSDCDGTEVTLSAPQGFETYLWNDGSTATSTTCMVQGDTVITCVANTVTGCQLTFSGTIVSQNVPMQDQDYYDTICQGDAYHNQGFELPPQMTEGDQVIHNVYYDITNCEEGATSTLYLHVVQRFYHIYDAACEGDDYNDYGFQFSQLSEGMMVDSTTVPRPGGCDSTTVLHLTVNASFTLPNLISGPTTVCTRSVEQYSISNYEGLTFFEWNIPSGVSIVSGQGTNSVMLFFSQDAPATSTITLTGANGCGNGSIPLDVNVFPAYYDYYFDTVCIGSDYSQHGFQLGVQDSLGYFIFVHNDTTASGCDSITALQIIVAGVPEITALADPTVICVGQETELHAVGANASVTLSSELPMVAVGDILCTDSTFVHPADWPCGKVAMGVVFYVDDTGQHGWAVNLQDEPDSLIWGLLLSLDIPTLTNYTGAFSTMGDLDGYQNTASIRASGTAALYPAAYQVDFEHGWYLPAAAQLYRIGATLWAVNNSLQIVGGVPFPMDSERKYWSSTEKSPFEAWALKNYSLFMAVNKSEWMPVRTVRNF